MLFRAKKSLLLFAFVLAPFAAALGDSAKIFLDSDENDVDPKKITVVEWYITADQLAKAPSHQPSADAPPLTVKAAIAAAQAEMKKHITAQTTWSLDRVELQQVDAGNTGETAQEGFINKPTGKWFYKVVFNTQRPDPKTTIWSEPYSVYVLMDGTLATRRERPQTKAEVDEDAQFSQGIKDAVLKDDSKSK